MWRLTCAFSVFIMVSACTSQSPPLPNASQIQSDIARIESVADVDCPNTAQKIHGSARTARDAIAQDDANLLNMTESLLAAEAVACKNEQDVSQQFTAATFDTKELAKFKRGGSASLTGQAFMRQRGGGIVTCAGESVTLLPATQYVIAVLPALMAARKYLSTIGDGNADVMVAAAMAAKGQRIREVQDDLNASILGKTACDAQGNFVFNGLATGLYVVLTQVTWMAGDERQGGPMEQDATVFPGTNSVILSQ